MPRPIVLLTDFGTADPFVGIVKCVIHAYAPGVEVIDLSHHVPPQDTLAGAVILEDALPWIPESGIVCAVVDPGVGGTRRALAVRSRHRVFVGPDNGLLTPVFRADPDARAFEIRSGGPIAPDRSATFHGRDVFAPAAALASRGEFDTFARPVDKPPTLLQWPAAEVAGDDSVRATVIHVDRFGNCALNVRRADAERLPDWVFGGAFRAEVGKQAVAGLARTYGDANKGEPLAYVNSAGRLELAVNGGSAATTFGIGRGSDVVLRRNGK